VVKKGVASRSPLPDRAANRDNVKTKVAGQVEEAAGYALDNAKGDPDAAIALVNKSDMDPSKKALVRQRIRERVKAGKPKTGKQSLADMLNGTKPPNVEPEPEEDEEN
jgi:Flp pilus assembly CpaF family ATPase